MAGSKPSRLPSAIIVGEVAPPVAPHGELYSIDPGHNPPTTRPRFSPNFKISPSLSQQTHLLHGSRLLVRHLSITINFLVCGGCNVLYYRSEFALAVRFSYIPAPFSHTYSTKSTSLDNIMPLFFSAHSLPTDSWIPHRGLDLTVAGWT
ncbi:hypothetical protein C8J56DRAFT_1060317 [Mycena floridula]|nr:hypothetical protein C8J56DRAFT_1060317 [Mycena floridula]